MNMHPWIKDEKQLYNTFMTWFFYRNATWTLQFAWLPKHCDSSNNLIWLRYGYRGIRSDEVLKGCEERWLTKDEFTMFALTKQYHQ